jgi:hypothetical protein
MAYDFMTLGPEDFENLTCDLLSASWSSQLEIFKTGKDQGIDLRHSRLIDGEVGAIVQCKRYDPNRYSGLLSAVKGEVEKLARLNPTRYVLVTSVPLSVHQKNELLEYLSPWCRGSEGIFAAAELKSVRKRRQDCVSCAFRGRADAVAQYVSVDDERKGVRRKLGPV